MYPVKSADDYDDFAMGDVRNHAHRSEAAADRSSMDSERHAGRPCRDAEQVTRLTPDGRALGLHRRHVHLDLPTGRDRAHPRRRGPRPSGEPDGRYWFPARSRTFLVDSKPSGKCRATSRRRSCCVRRPPRPCAASRRRSSRAWASPRGAPTPSPSVRVLVARSDECPSTRTSQRTRRREFSEATNWSP